MSGGAFYGLTLIRIPNCLQGVIVRNMPYTRSCASDTADQKIPLYLVVAETLTSELVF
jgi:hypothetical protein